MNTFFTYAPPIAGLAVFLSPLKTIREIQRNESTGDLPPLTYVSMSVMSAIWGTYGGLRSDMTVLVPNFIGSLLSLYYLYVFESYVKGAKSTELARWYQAGIIVLAIMLLYVAFADIEAAARLVGTSGAIMSTVFFLAPLAALPAVRRTRSPESIPFMTALMMFVNAALWFAYGFFVSNDKSIYLSNLSGVVSGGVQLMVHALFATGVIAKKASSESGVKVASL